MSIRSNIEAIMEQIKGGDTDLATQIQRESVAAIKNGQGSPEWETYMSRFAQTPDEFARLVPNDNTIDMEDMDLARATLVGNGNCGATSTGFHLLDGVDDKLDENL